MQRKDKPPDRDAHKFSPQHRASAAQRPSRNNNNRRQDRANAPTATPDAGPGQAPIPEGVINGVNEIMKRLSEQRRTRTGRAVPVPGPRRPRQLGCGSDGCLTITPTPRRPKSTKPRTYDLAYRYRIVTGRPDNTTIDPLDIDWNWFGFEDDIEFGGDFVVGLWDGVTGTVEVLGMLVNPAEWGELVDELAKILAFAREDPVEFLKVLANWEQWKTQPGRALGNTAYGFIPAVGVLSKVRALRKLLENSHASKGPGDEDADPNPDQAQQPGPAPQPAPDQGPAPVQQPGPGGGPDVPPGLYTPDRTTSDGSSTGEAQRPDGPAERDTTQVPAAPAPRRVESDDQNGRPTTGGTIDRSRVATTQGRSTSRAQNPFWAGPVPWAGAAANRGPNSARPGGSGTARNSRDAAVDPRVPKPRPTNRSIGRASHNRALQALLRVLPERATGVRVNQQQVTAPFADGIARRVGINRPDGQFTLDGKRYYVEFEGPDNPRGDLHRIRILSNDPAGRFMLVKIDSAGTPRHAAWLK